jgi:DnaK suppressor protein
MMTKKRLEHFKSLLDRTMVELLDEANKTVNDMTTHNGNLPDPTDRASLESDRNFTLRIRDRERKLIGKIKEALERIETGTYGICESCGEEISEERLEARPVTTLCIECKTKQEQEEKVRGQ